MGGRHLDADAALAYAWKNDEDTTESLIASGSLLHKPTGLNLSLSAGSDQSGDASYLYAKLGWKGDLIGMGGTAVSVDWYDGSDFVVAGSSSESWGVQLVQTFTDYSLEAYLGWRQYSYEDSAADYADVDVLLVGGRWKF